MYKVLIIDDFEADRQKLDKIISSRYGNQIEIAGQCETAIQALKFIEYNIPDIVISDIEMPYMNGLEMAKKIRSKYNNDIKIIFCTLYDEFRYAKEAIYSNSYGYVLKPVCEEELCQCINKVIGDISREQEFKKEYNSMRASLEKFKPVLIDNFLKEIIYGINTSGTEVWEKADYFGLKFIDGFFRVIYIEIDDYEVITAEQKIEQKQFFAIKVFEKIKKVIDRRWAYPITRIDEIHSVVIVSEDEMDIAKANSSICAKEIMNYAKKAGISLSISISDCSEKLGDVKNLFEQCKFIMRYKFNIGKGEILSSEDIPSSMDFCDIDINSLQKDIRYILNAGGKEDIIHYIDSHIAELSYKTDSDMLKNFCIFIIVCVRLILNENNMSFGDIFGNEQLLWDKLMSFETILDAGNWLKNILIFANEYIAKKSSNKNTAIVDEIKKFIEDNLNKSIGLDDLAEELHYSPNYLNYVFKQVSGGTISDYITNQKMGKAKELLTDVRNKVQDVSAGLGYSHAAYFCSVFKKNTGMTPKEFREKAI